MSDLSITVALPAFAAELVQSLRHQGRDDLAAQIATLPLVDRCRCGGDSCATFYTAAKPAGAYGKGHSNFQVDSLEGMIFLDLVDDQIRCIEVLCRPAVRKALFAILP